MGKKTFELSARILDRYRSGRDGIFLFLWVLSSALVVAIAVALTWQAATHLLRHEVQADAHSWVDYLKHHADDLDGILTSGADSSKSLEALRSAGESSMRCSFYRLYDRKGRPVYQSEALNGRLPFGRGSG